MRNLVERAVLDLYSELRVARPELCGCALCRQDVLAYVLNHARPRYSGGSDEGWAVTSVDLQRDQSRAALSVMVLEAMERIAVNPRHRARTGPEKDVI
ncbi:MAG: late competence development ComFB family protein [Gemmatimonadota bacterium]|nr:late competence development ComFB family protein [Gemmatimonadota bacterium]